MSLNPMWLTFMFLIVYPADSQALVSHQKVVLTYNFLHRKNYNSDIADVGLTQACPAYLQC